MLYFSAPIATNATIAHKTAESILKEYGYPGPIARLNCSRVGKGNILWLRNYETLYIAGKKEKQTGIRPNKNG